MSTRQKLLFSMALLFVTSSLFAGQGKVRVACNEKGAYIYVDGKKKAMTGEGFTNILLEEGDHVIKVVKIKDKQYQRYIEKNIFVGTDTSVKLSFKLGRYDERIEHTPSYKKILKKKDIPKLQRFKRNGNIVTDTKLGLMWQDDNSVKSNNIGYPKAKKYCQNLSLSGYNDWRLPTYNELLTLVDKDRIKISSTSIMPSFQNIAEGYIAYWTSNLYTHPPRIFIPPVHDEYMKKWISLGNKKTNGMAILHAIISFKGNYTDEDADYLLLNAKPMFTAYKRCVREIQ